MASAIVAMSMYHFAMGRPTCRRVVGSFSISWLWLWVLLCPFLSEPSQAAIDPDTLKCLVCRSTIDEFELAIYKLNPKKTVEIGNYRLDESGNIHQNRVPISKSQVHLSEMLDDICKKMTDYVRVRYKATKKLAIMKLMSEGGGMNPEFSYTDFVTDEDLNKSLEFYCEEIIGENEDNLIDIYAKRPEDDTLPDGKIKFCEEQLNLCEEWMLPIEADKDWSPEKESNRGGSPYNFGGETESYDDLEDDASELEMDVEERDEL